MLEWVWSFSARVRSPAEIAAQRAAKLERMGALLRALGEPQRAYPSLLVAGTKGKGSTVAMLAASLQASGRRTGRYTSPHLVNWRERTCIDGRPIEVLDVLDLAEPVRAAVAALPAALGQPTTFEVGTAIALLHFARQHVEVAVIEVGTGGREDATNLTDPLVSVITPISYDHMATLGDTLASIAGHKAGILRPGRPAIVAPQPAEAEQVVLAEAARLGSLLERVGYEWSWSLVPAAVAVTVNTPLGTLAPAARAPIRITARDPAVAPLEVAVALLGEHQRDNATAAVAALHALGRVRPDLVVGPEAIAAGLAAVDWPGRLQVLAQRPLVVLDGAHNGASAAALARAVPDVFRYRRLHLVLGLSAGKDARGVLEALAPLAAHVWLTRSHHERSAPPAELAPLAQAASLTAHISQVPEVADALAAAVGQASPDDLVLVTGSLFLVGEALVWWSQAHSSR